MSNATFDQKNYFKRIHTKLRKIGINNESEQRNIFMGVAGKRSLRAMSLEQLHDVDVFLFGELNPTPNKPEPVSDDEAQAWLD